MYLRRQLKELTIKDSFMFGAVMLDEENCRGLLEMVLGIAISRVEVSQEKSIVYHPEYKGIRLDVYAQDEKNTRYNIEMQVARKDDLGRRARYYHSQIDMELLLRGGDYAELPDTFVIFICDFDPFGEGKYCYTFETRCVEDECIRLGEGSISIFLSTHGKNEEVTSPGLVKFLRFVKADLDGSQREFGDKYISQLQQSIRCIKENRMMEERYMLFEEMLRDERAEGKAEGKAEDVLNLLEDSGPVPDDLRVRIMSEKDMEVLKRWLRLSVEVSSPEEFLKKM